jgi:hypothetical protein
MRSRDLDEGRSARVREGREGLRPLKALTEGQPKHLDFTGPGSPCVELWGAF